MENKPLQCIIYARVSSKEQEETGYSLDAQENLLATYAQKQGYKVAKTFKITESASGKQIRKMFNDMMIYTTKHSVPIILCEKIDRLTRNLKDAALISDWLNEDERREVHFVKESFVVNKNTRAHENLVWDMKVAIARFYTNNLSEEVKKGQKEKISQGGYPCMPPLGYKTIGEKGHKICVPDETKAPLIAKAFELYSAGQYSINALCRTMHEAGLRNRNGAMVSKTQMHRYLSETFYCGHFYWNGKMYKGTHTPIISQELYNLVQHKLVRSSSNPQYKKHLTVFKAAIKCGECGGVITWELQKQHWYGHCNHYRKCSQKSYLRQEEVEKQLFPYFDKIAPKNDRILQWLDEALKEHHGEEIKLTTTKRSQLNAQFERIQKRLEAMYLDKLDGRITMEFYDTKFKEFTEEKEVILSELQKLNNDNNLYYEAGYAIHLLASKAKEIYQSEKATVEEKRLLLSYVFSNQTLKDRTLAVNYTPAFEFLAKWVPLLNRSFEPSKKSLDKMKTEAFASARSVVLRGWDSNPRPIG